MQDKNQAVGSCQAKVQTAQGVNWAIPGRRTGPALPGLAGAWGQAHPQKFPGFSLWRNCTQWVGDQQHGSFSAGPQWPSGSLQAPRGAWANFRAWPWRWLTTQCPRMPEEGPCVARPRMVQPWAKWTRQPQLRSLDVRF